MNLTLQDDTIDRVVIASTDRKQLYLSIGFKENIFMDWQFFFNDVEDQKRIVTLMEYTKSITTDDLVDKPIRLVMHDYQIYGIAHPKKNKFFTLNSVSFEEKLFKN